LAQLVSFDKPTVCNTLEALDPAMTLYSFTKECLDLLPPG